MKYVSKSKYISLDLVTVDGEERQFLSRGQATAEFAEQVMKEFVIYMDAQKALPVSEQDKLFTASVKFLNMVFADFDPAWLKKHFSVDEIRELKEWATAQLAGIKKDGES